MAKRAKPKRTSRVGPASLTDAEWAIMHVVWEQQPVAAGTVQEALQPSHGWAYSTVKTTMDRMVAKGLLATQSIRNLQLFTALMTRQRARRVELRHCLRRAFDGALSPMIQFLVEEEKLSDAELDELRQLIQRSAREK
jgi:BlaI family transcriptional regulator, penicillinase repressor